MAKGLHSVCASVGAVLLLTGAVIAQAQQPAGAPVRGVVVGFESGAMALTRATNRQGQLEGPGGGPFPIFIADVSRLREPIQVVLTFEDGSEPLVSAPILPNRDGDREDVLDANGQQMAVDDAKGDVTITVYAVAPAATDAEAE